MSLRIVSLFSGIGGLESGFQKIGSAPLLFCENDPSAQAVLASNFSDIPIAKDIKFLDNIPQCDLLLAGFPCQDLSQAGKKVGIGGTRSGLIEHLFRLISSAKPMPRWLIIENVPYMLSLDSGNAMAYLTSSLEGFGYAWAYRVIDARAFGIPQRRPRMVLVASRSEDPRSILFGQSYDNQQIDGIPSIIDDRYWYGFYWTEGKRGVGWTKEGVPPIKGGSTIGIPSPPAIWIPNIDYFGTISLRDAEQLQGFPPDWTIEVENTVGLIKNSRWRLVGNAVNTRMSDWLASQIENPNNYQNDSETPRKGYRWPKAAWGKNGKAYAVNCTAWPIITPTPTLKSFLVDPLKPLSFKATIGFLNRAKQCTNVVYSERFLMSLQIHADKMS